MQVFERRRRNLTYAAKLTNTCQSSVGFYFYLQCKSRSLLQVSLYIALSTLNLLIISQPQVFDVFAEPFKRVFWEHLDLVVSQVNHLQSVKSSQGLARKGLDEVERHAQRLQMLLEAFESLRRYGLDLVHVQVQGGQLLHAHEIPRAQRGQLVRVERQGVQVLQPLKGVFFQFGDLIFGEVEDLQLSQSEQRLVRDLLNVVLAQIQPSQVPAVNITFMMKKGNFSSVVEKERERKKRGKSFSCLCEKSSIISKQERFKTCIFEKDLKIGMGRL